MSRLPSSPLRENTIRNLFQTDFLSDSECNNIESSSDSEEPVDDMDSDPTYEPNASSTSSIANRAVLSSDSENECDVDDPRPGRVIIHRHQLGLAVPAVRLADTSPLPTQFLVMALIQNQLIVIMMVGRMLKKIMILDMPIALLTMNYLDLNTVHQETLPPLTILIYFSRLLF
ncbi:hypothetical protein J6590_098817 [Homalodisca vitripennis]|nr:hypothetical protein J6590_019552 [Homalodisca vitripennis]KAG8314154.1 hypothetical protein J6590_098817 [Homalodisca vitripennis]